MSACTGDCDADGTVGINELVLGVNIVLGTRPLDDCRTFDANGNDTVDVNELVLAVNRVLNGCEAPTPTDRPTATPTATISPDCGDGITGPGEECDDGNRADGDGCRANCELEPGGNVCVGLPTQSGTNLRAELVVDNLESPLYVTSPPLDPLRLFIVEQTGYIRIFKNGALVEPPFLDIHEDVSCCGERGLLGLAFHPDYETNGRFFVYYTANGTGEGALGDVVIARYRVSSNPDLADADSRQILLTVQHRRFANHNGGNLLFGPDRYLYAAIGDGGSGGDPFESGQSDQTLLGKLLRFDIDVETPPYYAVPATNPNAGAGAPLGLIWAKGLRNAWRFAFDRATNDLYIADVGQNMIEEVDVAPAGSTGGENYGWDIFEGSQCFEPQPLFPTCPDPPTGYIMPVLEYDHAAGCSVTGGYVYRGCALPDLRGTYFYADYCTDFIRSFVYVGGSATDQRDWTSILAPGNDLNIRGISSFGEDVRGELYICDLIDGEVFKIVAEP